MCCFSGRVKVEHTDIFARSAPKGRQYLVYQMSVLANNDVAMILPLPVPPKSADDAVRFINLEKYPKFFEDLERTFFEPTPNLRGGGGGLGSDAKPLPVVEVGSYAASFVPKVADFDRLDSRFRLPKETWNTAPYPDYGFAVFKLKAGNLKVHPMAFEFPRRDPSKLFFPTVHAHGDTIRPEATFHHVLYMQPGDSDADLMNWDESVRLAGAHVKMAQVKGIVAQGEHVYKRRIFGKLPNEVVWV